MDVVFRPHQTSCSLKCYSVFLLTAFIQLWVWYCTIKDKKRKTALNTFVCCHISVEKKCIEHCVMRRTIMFKCKSKLMSLFLTGSRSWWVFSPRLSYDRIVQWVHAYCLQRSPDLSIIEEAALNWTPATWKFQLLSWMQVVWYPTSTWTASGFVIPTHAEDS